MPRFSPVLSASTKPFKKFTNYRPLGYNYKIVLPPVLRDYVSNKSDKAANAYCVEEMSVMMGCWKRNDFNQQRCSQELASFHKCVVAAEVAAGPCEFVLVREQFNMSVDPGCSWIMGGAQKAMRAAAEQGKSVLSGGRYPSSQVNKMLKRYPQPPISLKLK